MHFFSFQYIAGLSIHFFETTLSKTFCICLFFFESYFCLVPLDLLTITFVDFFLKKCMDGKDSKYIPLLQHFDLSQKSWTSSLFWSSCTWASFSRIGTSFNSHSLCANRCQIVSLWDSVTSMAKIDLFSVPSILYSAHSKMATKCTGNNWNAHTFQKVHTGCIKYFREKIKEPHECCNKKRIMLSKHNPF